MFHNLEVRDALREAERQDAKWGDQIALPDGTGPFVEPLRGVARLGQRPVGHLNSTELADLLRTVAQQNAASGDISWLDVLLEEVFEAAAESDVPRLLDELNQVAAVAMQWRNALYRRAERPHS